MAIIFGKQIPESISHRLHISYFVDSSTQYTDGCVRDDDIRDGGSAFVVTCGDPDNIDMIHLARQRVRPFMSPYKERESLSMALD